MSIDAADFRVRPSKKVKMKDWPTEVDPFYESKEQYNEFLVEHIKKLSALQTVLYADDRYSLLLIFQAMDAAGKDGAISHVMSGLNPQGCQVFSFKQPSSEELDHDFLWRTVRALPERGRIGIFNRSYYEEVLVARVHPEILKAERLPDGLDAKKSIWDGRYRSMTDFEKHLHRNGTRVIKFFLHLSKNEQRKRFLKRIDDTEKNWKFSAADVAERQYWDDYMTAYEECLSATSTSKCPWYIVPADDKRNARMIISEIILETFGGLQLSYPTLSPEHECQLEEAGQALKAEKSEE